MGCSSVMLVINKVALSYVPLPACVFFLQFGTTSLCIVAGKSLGLLRVDDFTTARVRKFVPYACSFVLSIYCNGKVLQYSNVETLITFRACSPLFVSLLDWLLLGREFPSLRSLLALLGLVAGAIGYVLCDSEFQMHGVGAYGWVSAYLVVITFEMTYAKHTVSNVEFDNVVWGSVLYTNSLALGPAGVLAIGSGEIPEFLRLQLDIGGSLALVICCILGIGMNWSGWNCRSKISAASYTLLGVACKLFSVLLNVCIWDKHATKGGIFSLLGCLLASTLYKQAPLRKQQGERVDE